ncbi:flagellar filament capping protein FliD [Marinomonas sp. TI.3.20]|uniref:flagellar filament capping protein FliD n=1 Tax=Marinomonas sp. TI.3.20 TaxID=3121296 RepID=UPI00311EA969
MPVGSLGVGSGIDLDSLVKKMVSAQRDSKVKLYQDKIHGYDSKLSALGSVGSAIDTFKSSVEKLNDSKLFSGRNALIDQPDDKKSLDVTADRNSSNGSYEIAVNQTAKGSRILSAPGLFSSSDEVITARGGKLKLSAGDDSFTINVPPGTTLSQLRKQINSSENNFGVSANLVDNGKGSLFFTITSTKEGDGNSLKISNTPDPLAKLPISDTLTADEKDAVEKAPLNSSGLSLDSVSTEGLSAGMVMSPNDNARDAIITVDGIQISNNSNTFDKAVSGLSIDALALTTKPTKVEVSYDEKTVKETIKSFVSSYNDLVGVLGKSAAKGSVLNGNSMVRNLQSSMSSSFMLSHSDTGKLSTVFDLGLKMGRDGTLSLNEAKLDKAVSTNYDELPKLFTGSGGLASSLERLLNSYTGREGMSRALKDSIQKSKDNTEETLQAYEGRMKKYEDSLRDKFSHLDSQLSNMKAQGNYLNTMLGQMK